MDGSRVKKRIPRGLFAEMAVIVASVFVALAADRWNQSRGDRALEAAYLDRFAAELSDDRSSAEAYLEGFDAVVLATDSLLTFVDGGTAPPSLASTVPRAFQQFKLPAASTWNEMLSSSSLGLVRDPAIRKILSEYYGSRRPELEENLARSDRRGRDPFTDALYPMGLFRPCMPGRTCDLGSASFGAADYRLLDAEVFRAWPGIRELIVGLESHHGTQRLFARALAEAAAETLRALEAAR